MYALKMYIYLFVVETIETNLEILVKFMILEKLPLN